VENLCLFVDDHDDDNKLVAEPSLRVMLVCPRLEGGENMKTRTKMFYGIAV